MIMPHTAYFFTASQHQNNTQYCVSGALWIDIVQVHIIILALQTKYFIFGKLLDYADKIQCMTDTIDLNILISLNNMIFLRDEIKKKPMLQK